MEGEFGTLLLSINPPGKSYYYLDMTPNMCPRFSGDSQISWPKPQLCTEARGMSQGLQGLTKYSFLSRRPDQGDGLSGNCNVDLLMHTQHMERTYTGSHLTERQGAAQRERRDPHGLGTSELHSLRYHSGPLRLSASPYAK